MPGRGSASLVILRGPTSGARTSTKAKYDSHFANRMAENFFPKCATRYGTATTAHTCFPDFKLYILVYIRVEINGERSKDRGYAQGATSSQLNFSDVWALSPTVRNEIPASS